MSCDFDDYPKGIRVSGMPLWLYGWNGCLEIEKCPLGAEKMFNSAPVYWMPEHRCLFVRCRPIWIIKHPQANWIMTTSRTDANEIMAFKKCLKSELCGTWVTIHGHEFLVQDV